MERKEKQDVLLNNIRIDPLTQLWNGDFIKQNIQDYLEEVGNTHTSAMLVLDLDDFKKVNDVYGHLEGDRVLIRTAGVLEQFFGETDILGRTGADEFIVFMKDIKSELELSKKCKEICLKISNCFNHEFPSVSLTCSVGAIYVQNIEVDYKGLLQRANVALYQAQFNGKNTYHMESKKFNNHKMMKNGNLGLASKAQSTILSRDHMECAEDSFENKEKSFATRIHQFYRMSVIVLLLIFVLIWIGAILGTHAINQNFYEKTLQQQAMLIMHQKSLCIKTHAEQAVQVSKNAMIKEFLREKTTMVRRTELKSEIVEEILSSMKLLNVFSGMSIEGKNKNFYLDTSRIPILDKSMDNFPDTVGMKFKEDGFAVNLCQYNEKSEIMITCPVMDKDKEVLGYIRVFLDSCLLTLPEDKKYGEGMFLDLESGRVFYENVCSDSGVKDKVKNSTGLLKGVQKNLENGKLFYYISEKGIPMIGVVSQWSNYPLAFVAAVEKEDMTQMVYQYTFYQILMNLGLLCLLTALLYFIYNYTNKPVNIMIEQCRKMAGGDHSIVFEAQQDKDLNLLADTFNRYRERVEEAAYVDPLLKIGNRAKCTYDIAALIAEKATKELSIFMIDIKEFSKYNDVFSIKIGDEILKEVFRRLACIFGTNLYRMNGDVFLGININKKEDRKTLDSIKSSLGSVMIIDNAEFNLQYNVGICNYPIHGSNVSELLERSQSALSYAKKQLVENTIVYNEKITDILRREDEILALLRRRISERSLEVWYQPIYDSRSGQFTAAEALLRLRDDRGDFISSYQVAVIAEKNNVVAEIGEYVLEETCDTIKVLRSRNCSLFEIHINLSVQQMMQKDYVERTLDLIRTKGVEPHQVGIEVTETMLIQSFDSVIDVLTKLRSVGMHISMDDFGSEYSSLNYLVRLPVDKLKLDRDLVLQVTENQEQFAFIKKIMEMAKIKNMEVIAEGVERKETFDKIVQCGADCIQGYYFSKALPRKELIAFLEKNIDIFNQ